MAVRKQALHRRDRPQLEELAAEGMTRKGISSRLGMLYADFQKALKRDPVALLRLEAGEASHEQTLIDRLNRLSEARGPAATTPLLFLLKSRHRWNDRPPAEPQTISSTVNISLPASLPLDRYTKEVTAQVERAKLTEGGDDE